MRKAGGSGPDRHAAGTMTMDAHPTTGTTGPKVENTRKLGAHVVDLPTGGRSSPGGRHEYHTSQVVGSVIWWIAQAICLIIGTAFWLWRLAGRRP